MSYQDIRTETRGASSWIILNRPEQMNAVRAAERTGTEEVDS